MGIKKYEIITVGSDKRVRALRSWQVQDRYVNIGDVGGIVYDEKTLSQDGACWLFKGNFNFPGARIGGDSIVDVGEAAISANGAPNVDILGNSTVVGAPVSFSSDRTEAGTYETKLSIIDSRVEINPATSVAIATIKPGGTYTIAPGAKYPEAIIRNSKVSIIVPAVANRAFRLMGQVIGSTATLDATGGDVTLMGQYSNVKNLLASGILSTDISVAAYDIIQATDCDNFVVSPTIFPGLADAQTANMPFIFQGCNVPNGLFYHHAQINNIYTDVDFSATGDSLGKRLGPATQVVLVSSEQTGMYRVYRMDTKLWGALVESYNSVSALRFASDSPNSSYNTTIYKDAYINGWFDIAGTNVFGNKARSHPLAQVLDVQPRVVQGNFSATSVGATIGAIVTAPLFVSTPVPFRVNGAKGLTVNNLPAGYVALLLLVDQNNVITRVGSGAEALPVAALTDMKAFIRFSKSDGSSITPADLAGVTVTVYNGCKIVNTGETAVNMKGNTRVEDNATLVNASITGSAYFGGNSVMSGMNVNGYAYMKDNAICTKTSENVQTFASLVMEGNAVYNSIASLAYSGLEVFMYDNSKVLGDLRSAAPILIMRDNATITAAGSLSGASSGAVVIKDNAVINASTTLIGAITLAGNYKGNVVKTWTGKRTITDVNAPEYDNNVKTQYDF